MKKYLALTVAGLGALLTLAFGLAAPAQASTTSLKPMINCGWHPANDNGYTGWLTSGAVIRTGQSNGCGAVATAGAIDTVDLRCYTDTPTEGRWIYIFDPILWAYGWVPDEAVRSGTLPYVKC